MHKKVILFLVLATTTSNLIIATPNVPAQNYAYVNVDEYDEFDLISDTHEQPVTAKPQVAPRWYVLTQYPAVKKAGLAVLLAYVKVKGKFQYYWQAFRNWLSNYIELDNVNVINK